LNTKNKLTVAILIATFLLSPMVSVRPARADPSPSAAIVLSNPSAYPGESIVARVMISNAPFIAGFDLTVNYNADVFTELSIDIAGGIVFSRYPVHSSLPGFVHYAGVMLGCTPADASAPSQIIAITLMVNNPPGASASELPSAITLSDSLVALESDGACSGEPSIASPTTTGASYAPPSVTIMRSVGCRATNPGFNVKSKGFTDGLFCRVVNSGTESVLAGAVFTWTSVNGVTGSAASSAVTLAPGQTAELTASITVPNAKDLFTVTGSVGYGMPDGSAYATLLTPYNPPSVSTSQTVSFLITVNA